MKTGEASIRAVTFCEECDPQVSEEDQYDMYGDRFGYKYSEAV